MSDPIPTPAGGEPAVASSRAAEEGCLKPVLVGCGALTLFLGIAILVLVVRADDLVRWTLDKMETQIVSALPEEIDEATRLRLDEALVGFREVLATGQVDTIELQRFRSALLEYSAAAAEGLTPEDVNRLIRSLERLAGVAEEPEPEPPVQQPDPIPVAGPVAAS